MSEKNDFSSVFEGITKTRQDIEDELKLLKSINDEQKIELRKAKHFNLLMLVIGLVSLAASIASLVFTIVRG